LLAGNHGLPFDLDSPRDAVVGQRPGRIIGQLDLQPRALTDHLEQWRHRLVDLSHLKTARLGAQIVADDGFQPVGGQGVDEMELEIAADRPRREPEAGGQFRQHVGLVFLAGRDVLAQVGRPLPAETDDLPPISFLDLHVPPEDIGRAGRAGGNRGG